MGDRAMNTIAIIFLILLAANLLWTLVLTLCKDKRVFYGPYDCPHCRALICKAAREDGGAEYDYPEGPIYPNTLWVRHAHYWRD